MMALEKEQACATRPPTPSIQDIQRYLTTGRPWPPLPAPPTGWKKFVKRNRTGVVAAACVWWPSCWASPAPPSAWSAPRRAEKRAKLEAETARQVSDFMVGLFEVSDPGEARGNTITAREILDQGVLEIETGLADQPATQASLMNTMGRVYKELGLYRSPAPAGKIPGDHGGYSTPMDDPQTAARHGRSRRSLPGVRGIRRGRDLS